MRRSYRRGKRLLVFLALSLIVTTSHATAETGVCDAYSPEAVRTGSEPESLRELSGLVVGRRHSDLFWAENDSGNPFELFAQRVDGTVMAHFPLKGGENVDIEDIAAAPCLEDPSQPCIYLADIGDNDANRKEVAIYEVLEPSSLDAESLSARKLRFTYPDGAHNAETLLADPHTSQMYVVTKEPGGLGTLYRLEGLRPDKVGYAVGVVHLAQAGIFSVLTTGGDVHPSGTRVLLRTYTGVFEYRGKPGQTVEQIMSAQPLIVPGGSQPQGEAISYTADGRGYVLGSERPGSPIYRIDCAK